MKVAIFRPLWARTHTAFEVQARMYAYLQQEYGLEVTVFADADNHFRYEGLRVVDVKRRASTWPSRLLHKLGLLSGSEYPRWQQLRGYDVIETSDPTLNAYADTAYRAVRAFGSRLVCGSSVTLSTLFETNYRQAKRVMDAAYRVGCMTLKAQERFVKLGLLEENSSRVVILGYAIDVDLFRPAPLVQQNETVRIISVGRVSKEKGHLILLQAIANLHQEGHKITWEVIGKGSEEHLVKQEVSRLGLSSIVQFRGKIANDQLPNYYAQADIFAFHQLATEHWEEYFGVVMAESMSCGVPVVATNTGGIPHVVRDGETGQLVEQGDAEQLTTALRVLVVNPELRKKMGHAGREHIVENFAARVVAKRYLQLWGLER